jgi:hypothetical protein
MSISVCCVFVCLMRLIAVHQVCCARFVAVLRGCVVACHRMIHPSTHFPGKFAKPSRARKRGLSLQRFERIHKCNHQKPDDQDSYQDQLPGLCFPSTTRSNGYVSLKHPQVTAGDLATTSHNNHSLVTHFNLATPPRD